MSAWDLYALFGFALIAFGLWLGLSGKRVR